jgi:hypothetical protein
LRQPQAQQVDLQKHADSAARFLEQSREIVAFINSFNGPTM